MRAQARKQFGSVAAQAERVRDVNSSILLNEITQDIRYAFRQMRRHPGFALIAVVIIALGISSVTTIFSLVDAVLFHSLPYKDAAKLVYLWTPNAQFAAANIPQEIGPNYPDALDWRAHSHSFSSMAMIEQHVFNLTRSNVTVRTGGAIVGGAFFQTLGIQPQVGHAFDSSDSKEGQDHVAVISDGLWHRLFAGEARAIGRSIHLDREDYEVIGIMPEGFGYPFEGDIPYGASHYGRTDVWVPLVVRSERRTDCSNPQSADAMIARLRDVTTARETELELNSIEKPLDRLYPPELRGYTVLVHSLRDTIIGPVQVLLWILLGSVTVVLLIACGNVSNLLLARATTRVEEIVIRVSLGAGRSRLIRQILTEPIVLSLSGCVIGLILSLAAVRLLRHMNPGDIPHFDAAALNWPVLLMSIAVSVLSGVLFGLIPALIPRAQTSIKSFAGAEAKEDWARLGSQVKR
jgi:predicted permease